MREDSILIKRAKLIERMYKYTICLLVLQGYFSLSPGRIKTLVKMHRNIKQNRVIMAESP